MKTLAKAFKNLTFDRVLAALAVALGLSIIVAFFMPWVKGTGSVLEPLYDSSRNYWYLDFTGVIRALIIGAKKVVDFIAVVFFRKKLIYILRGYQVPLIMYNTEGREAYLLYFVPLAAITYIWLNLIAHRRRVISFLTAIISFSMFFLLYGQEVAFNHEELFINIKECWGFRTSIYLFLAAAIVAIIRMIIFPRSPRDKIHMIIRGGRGGKDGVKLFRG